MSSKDLVRELVSDASLLLRRQLELARMEATRQTKHEKRAVKLLTVGAALAYAGGIFFLLALAAAIGLAFGALWAGALLVGAVLLVGAAIAGTIGWTRRERIALPRTRRELQEEISWAKTLTT